MSPRGADRPVEPGFGALLAVVFIGGMTGSLLRWGLTEATPFQLGHWPWATFIANVVGCFVLGYVVAHPALGRYNSRRSALIGTGFCGGLTTFSTFQLELYRMLDAGELLLGVAYLTASVIAGYIAVSIGHRHVGDLELEVE